MGLRLQCPVPGCCTGWRDPMTNAGMLAFYERLREHVRVVHGLDDRFLTAGHQLAVNDR